MDTFQIRWHRNIGEIPKEKWQRLAKSHYSPFFEWDWLHGLETSKSVGPEAGILPLHLGVWQGDRLAAAAPLYLKYHGQGEFVFDNALCDAAERLGFSYYPKLLGMSPYTPVVGYRFFTEQASPWLTGLMLEAVQKMCVANKIFGTHFLFVDPEWKKEAIEAGYQEWIHPSYIWKNRDFKNFEDYLSHLNSKRRKNIRKERKKLLALPIDFSFHQGRDITLSKREEMYRLYCSTCDKFLWWGSKYLTRDFFRNLSPENLKRLLFIQATEKNTGRSLGMAFYAQKGEKLFGRYWGCTEEIEFLHFELCYYRPIQWAIENGIREFDAGAGNGPHKKRRGFPAKINSSLHFFHNPKFHDLVANYFAESNLLQKEQIRHFNSS